MSGINNKSSKIARIRETQLDHNACFDNLFGLVRLGHESDRAIIEKLTATNEMLTKTAASLEADNKKLREYLGSELFKRRQRDVQIPTLSETVSDEAERLRMFRALARVALHAHVISGGPGITADPSLSAVREILEKIAGLTRCDSLEPHWGNRENLLPHTGTKTV